MALHQTSNMPLSKPILVYLSAYHYASLGLDELKEASDTRFFQACLKNILERISTFQHIFNPSADSMP